MGDRTLPMFENREVDDVVLRFGGAVTRRKGTPVDTTVVLVVQGEISAVGHTIKNTKSEGEVLLRAESLRITDAWDVSGKKGEALLAEVQRSHRLAEDEAAGREQLPDPVGDERDDDQADDEPGEPCGHQIGGKKNGVACTLEAGHSGNHRAKAV